MPPRSRSFATASIILGLFLGGSGAAGPARADAVVTALDANALAMNELVMEYAGSVMPLEGMPYQSNGAFNWSGRVTSLGWDWALSSAPSAVLDPAPTALHSIGVYLDTGAAGNANPFPIIKWTVNGTQGGADVSASGEVDLDPSWKSFWKKVKKVASAVVTYVATTVATTAVQAIGTAVAPAAFPAIAMVSDVLDARATVKLINSVASVPQFLALVSPETTIDELQLWSHVESYIGPLGGPHAYLQGLGVYNAASQYTGNTLSTLVTTFAYIDGNGNFEGNVVVPEPPAGLLLLPALAALLLLRRPGAAPRRLAIQRTT